MAIFGSFVKGDFTEESDIDLLARFSKPKNLLDLVRIERVFLKVLGRKTDLLTEASISPYLTQREFPACQGGDVSRFLHEVQDGRSPNFLKVPRLLGRGYLRDRIKNEMEVVYERTG